MDLTTSARDWINTPWRHNTCKKGLGVDCVNFLFAVAKESGYKLPPLPSNYSRVTVNDEILTYLNTNLQKVSTIERDTVLLFQFAGYNNHVAIATSTNTMIHASQSHRKVLEHPIDGIWLRMLKGKFKLEENK